MLDTFSINKKVIRIFMLTIIFIMLFSISVFAGTSDKGKASDSSTTETETVLKTQTANDVAKKAIDSIKPALLAFGGLCVFSGVAMIGFKLIFAHNNPDKRISAMSGLLYIGIGAFMVGGCMLVAGFFWGLGQ